MDKWPQGSVGGTEDRNVQEWVGSQWLCNVEVGCIVTVGVVGMVLVKMAVLKQQWVDWWDSRVIALFHPCDPQSPF